MSCNVQVPLDQFPESEQVRDMVYLFDVASKRFSEAVEAQRRSEENDVRFFSLDVLDGETYYVITLVRSYEGLVARNTESSDLYEILIPALLVDIDEPAVDQLRGNPDAYFMVRSYLEEGNAAYLVARPYKFEEFVDVTATIGGVNPFFDSVVDKKYCAYHLASRLNDYEMIPSGVRDTRQEVSPWAAEELDIS